MDYVNAAFLALIFFTLAVDKILKRLSWPKGGKRDFPTCYNCNKGCIRMPTLGGLALPEDILSTLEEYDLPDKVVTRFQCETGCSNLWWIPQIGDMPKGVLRTRRVR